MAREFATGSSQYLRAATTPVTAVPLTLACWFWANDVTNPRHLFNVADSGTTNNAFFLYLALDQGGDPLRFYSGSAGATDFANTSTAISANTWHHACGVTSATNSRAVYIDGGSKGTNATAVTPTGIDRITIGVSGDSTPFGYMDGKAAEGAIWNTDLNDLEAALLAAGASPLQIRPQNLVAYWPFVRDDLDRSETNLSDRFHLTPFNSPTFQTHPPKIYRVAPLAAQFIETDELYRMSEPLSHFDFTTPVRRRWMFVVPAVGANAPTADIQGPLIGPLGGPIAV